MTRCRAPLAATATALLLSVAHARTDIPTQLQELSRVLTSPPPAPSRLNAALQTTLASQNLSSFTPALQRALLWDAGYVRISSAGANATSYLNVYVPCGRTMNDVFLGVDAVSGVTDCPLKVCKEFSINFAQSTCDVDALAEIAQCAVVEDDATALSTAVANASRRPAWSQDGDLDSLFDPQMTLQKGTTETLYLISEQGAANFVGSDTTCLSTAKFIVPCRQVGKNDVAQTSEATKWCHPTSQLGVKLWMQNEVKMASGSSTSSKSGGSTASGGADTSGTAGTTTSSDTESSSSSTVSVVLGVLLSFAVILCIVLLVLYCRKSKSYNNLENPETPGYTAVAVNGGTQRHNKNGSTGTNQSSNQHASTKSTSVNVEAVNESFKQKSAVLAAFIDDQELMMKRIAFTGLYFKKMLASGANGEVWRGEYQGNVVAIKKALVDKKDEDIKTLETFSQEIRLASGLEHPNIVRFVGLSWRTLSDLCMVSEFMAMGDLAHFLASEDGQSMTWSTEKVGIAADIANALVYLHSLLPMIIHRDLKSLNVLLTDDLQAKLSDFGLSREQSFENTMTSGVGTMLWTAPEVLRGERYSEKADMYSFGIVLSELDTCLAPYSLNEEMTGVKSKGMHLLPLISKGQISPKFSPTCPEPVLELAKACLDQDPSKRPPAMQVVYTLRSKIRPVL